MIGKPMAVAVNDIVEIAKFEIEKLRSSNRLNGTSGSARFFDCQTTKITKRATPPTIEATTQPFQWYLWPCWMPNTRKNMPRPLSATPHQSNRWVCVGND